MGGGASGVTGMMPESAIAISTGAIEPSVPVMSTLARA
jgi:hypothetical protein